MPPGKWLLIFGAIAVASAFVLPVVFAGVPIYDDGRLVSTMAGSFGLRLRVWLVNNVTRAVYLALHIATAFALFSIKFSAVKVRKAYLLAFYIEVFFVFAESLCQLARIQFPLWLVLNNPGYSLWDNSREPMEREFRAHFRTVNCGRVFSAVLRRLPRAIPRREWRIHQSDSLASGQWHGRFELLPVGSPSRADCPASSLFSLQVSLVHQSQTDKENCMGSLSVRRAFDPCPALFLRVPSGPDECHRL